MVSVAQSLAVFLAVAGSGVAAASAGCGKNPISSGQRTTNVAGQNRVYTVKVPNGYDKNKPYRLVFAYHWLNGDMAAVVNAGYYALEPLAQGNAIFVAAEGINKGWANTNGNDVKLTEQMLSDIKNNLCIDESQIFATGWSYGGAMSYSLACSHPDVFRAVSVISGASLSGCSGGTKPVAYLGIHGVVDSVLNISLGRSLRDQFLRNNGCASKNAPEPSPGSGSHIKTEYTCSNAPTWWIAHSGDHVPDPQDSNGDKWAPRETWSFFNLAAGSGSGSGSSTTTSATSTTSGTTPTGATVPLYGQCGGEGYNGPTTCATGRCVVSNQWYSQCLP